MKSGSREPRRALVLGDDSRSALAVVRSLGRAGIDVTLGYQDARSIVRSSRYARAVVRLPSTETNLAEWIDAVLELLRRRPVDLVVPTADDSLVPMVENRDRFETFARCAIPDEHGFRHTHDKALTFAMARELGVPSPNSVCLASTGDLERFLARRPLEFPLVVKPASTQRWIEGRGVVLRTGLARDAEQLEQRVSGLLAATPVLVQSFASGIGLGQEFLARDGEILAAFQHERVHELPGGGGGSYRRSVAVTPEILEHSRAMLRYLRWTGVVMIEWRRARDSGQLSLMEINGRFWGSLPLAVAAGADFPAWLFDLLVEGRAPEQKEYRVGLYARHAWNDLKWFPRNLLANRNDPLLQTYSPVRALLEPANMVANRERWDTLTADDPAPFFSEAARECAGVLRLAGGALRRAGVAGSTRIPAWRGRLRAKARSLLERRPSVLVLCLGNICRSPFAEAYLRRRLAEADFSRVSVTSAGFFPVTGRKVPRQGLEAARELGVELASHRSRLVTPELLEESGVLLFMDPDHLARVCRDAPEAASKAFLLRAFSEEHPGATIPDPWGRSMNDFRSGYRVIASAMNDLLAAVSS